MQRRLRVSDNRRFLVYEDGSPFFYLGDTAWELFHRLNRAEAERYLRNRAAKGFTVIQAVVLAECDGLHDPNPYGQTPLIDDDPTQPNEEYFEHVDFIVEMATSLGLHIGMLPTWGDKWNKGTWGKGPEVFTPENARIYGEWLARRYRDAPLLWILGGDRPVETDAHRAVIDSLAAGLRTGDGGNRLITFHPVGGTTSSQPFPDAAWLDFHMWQSGHGRNRANYDDVTSDYQRTPVKPCMDAEPGYEDHPAGFNLDNGYLDDYDCRKSLYWSLFAGAHGHTYGCHPIWQMWQPGRQPHSHVRRPWWDALDLPGAGQMHHAKDLLLSRPFLTRVPDQTLLASEPGAGTHHVRATRDAEGSYALIYCPTPRPVEINTATLSGNTLVAHWYDPRTGVAQHAGTFPRGSTQSFTPPPVGPDWVLILDDASHDFPAPGAAILASG
jgi:hypothetical protein